MILTGENDPSLNNVNQKPAFFHATHAGVDIHRIRLRQRALLPALIALRDAAFEALERQIHLLPSSACNLRTDIIYRRPDHPDFLQYFTHELSDYPVVVSLARQGESTAFKSLATEARSDLLSYEPPAEPLQYGQVILPEHLSSIDPERLTRPAENGVQYGVVFPHLMKFVVHWVRELDGPIHSLRFAYTRPENLPARTINPALMLGAGNA